MCQLNYCLGAKRVSILVTVGLSVSKHMGSSTHVPVELAVLVPMELSILLTMCYFFQPQWAHLFLCKLGQKPMYQWVVHSWRDVSLSNAAHTDVTWNPAKIHSLTLSHFGLSFKAFDYPLSIVYSLKLGRAWGPWRQGIPDPLPSWWELSPLLQDWQLL